MRIRTILVLVAAAAFLAWGLWMRRTREAAEAHRAADWQSRQLIEATDAALDKKYSFSHQTIPLEDFAQLIGTLSGLAVDIDQGTLDERGRDVDVPGLSLVIPSDHAPLASTRVNVPGGNLSLRSVLDLALEPHGLTYDVREQRLVITTEDESRDQNEVFVQVYPLPQPEFVSQQVGELEWEEILGEATDHDWVNFGGRGYVEFVPGALVVCHTARAHRQIRSLMELLDGLENPRSWTPVRLATHHDREADRRIQAALHRPAWIDCRDLALRDFARHLSREHDLPILLAEHKLEETGVSLDAPITKKLHGLTLQSLLRNVLRDFELTTAVRGEVLVITSPEDAEEHETCVAFPVHDLVYDPANQVYDYDTLLEIITGNVSPQAWELSGPTWLGPSLDGWLVIRRTDEIHDQIEQLLALLREEPNSEDQRQGATERILAALDQPLALECRDTPLREVADDLSERLGIPVALREPKLIELGISPTAPISVELAAAPFREQLTRLLRERGLAWTVRNEVLEITSPEDAESNLITRTYDVYALLDPDFGGLDHEQLVDLITQSIAPASWGEVGGPGSINLFRYRLVVSHTEEMLRRVEKLLTELESGLRERN